VAALLQIWCQSKSASTHLHSRVSVRSGAPPPIEADPQRSAGPLRMRRLSEGAASSKERPLNRKRDSCLILRDSKSQRRPHLRLCGGSSSIQRRVVDYNTRLLEDNSANAVRQTRDSISRKVMVRVATGEQRRATPPSDDSEILIASFREPFIFSRRRPGAFLG
jgi:hypothetical protein